MIIHEKQTEEVQEVTQEEVTTQEVVQEAVPETVAETQAPVVEDQGTTESAAPVVEEVTAEPTPVVEVTQEVQAVEVTQSDYIAFIRATGTANQKALIAVFEDYIEQMKPGKVVTREAGANAQFLLWSAIKKVIEVNPIEEFTSSWNLILEFFIKYGNAALGPRYVYRFAEFWRWPVKELDIFQRLINIIELTKDTKSRSLGLKQVDLDRSLAKGLSEQGRSRVASFYKN